MGQHRHRSPDGSRRRKRERKGERVRYDDVPVVGTPSDMASLPAQQQQPPLQAYTSGMPRMEPPPMQRPRAASSSGSASSSTSSSLLDISRRHVRSGGFINTFFRSPRRRRARTSTRRRGFMPSGNSSSSSISSDMAYGNAYIPRPRGAGPRSRSAGPPRRTRSEGVVAGTAGMAAGAAAAEAFQPGKLQRTKTDEEIQALGRQLSDIAVRQNEEDLRRMGKNKPSRLTSFSAGLDSVRRQRHGQQARGIGSSRPHGGDSDDEDWESASDHGSSDDADSGLAYGSHIAGAAGAALGGAALGGAMASYGGRRRSSQVDPRLFGPVNSLHGLVTPVGFRNDQEAAAAYAQRDARGPDSLEQVPMRDVYPVPTSEPGRFDARGSSTSISRQDLPQQSSRPGPVPLQYPIPKAPVPSKVYDADRLEEASRRESGDKRRRSDSDGWGDVAKIGAVAAAGVAAGAVAESAMSGRRSKSEKSSRGYRDRDEPDRDDRTRTRRSDEKRSSDKRSDDRRSDDRRSSDKRSSDKRSGDKRSVDDERRDRDDKERYRESERDREPRKSKSESSKYDDGKDHKRSSRYDDNQDTPRKKRETTADRPHDKVFYERGGEEIQVEYDPESRQTSRKGLREDEPGESTRELPGADKARDGLQTMGSADPVARPLTPQVFTVDRVPSFDDSPPRTPVGEGRLSRKDSFEIENKVSDRKTGPQGSYRNVGHDYEEDEHHARSIYDEAKHATVPIAAAAMASAIAVEEERSRERRRGNYSADGSRDRNGYNMDSVQEDADRYYRESVIARKIAQDEIRSQKEGSSRWEADKDDEPVAIVTPPEMSDRRLETSPYDGPNADVRIDNEIFPHETHRFRTSGRDLDAPVFKSRDPSCERDRPLLNLVLPTPLPSRDPSPNPEQQRQQDEIRELNESSSKSDGASEDVTEPKGEQSKSSSTFKSVSWGENETKSYEAETPEPKSDTEPSYDKAETAEKPRPRLNKSSRWGKIAAAFAGSSAEPANEPDVNAQDSEKRSSDEPTSRDAPGADLADSAPPVPGPKPASPNQEQMAGHYPDDIAFAATLAAGLKTSGFDDNIVLDDPSYHRRDSPPGSDEELNGGGLYWKKPVSETVTDVGIEPTSSRDIASKADDIAAGVETSRDEPIQGSDEWAEVPSKLTKKEKRRLEKLAKTQSSETTELPIAESSETQAFDDAAADSTKISKKEQRKLDKASKSRGLQSEEQLQELESAPSPARDAKDDAWEDTPRRKSKNRKSRDFDDDDSKVTVPVDAYKDLQLSNDDPSTTKNAESEDEWDVMKDKKKKKKKSKRKNGTEDDFIEYEEPPDRGGDPTEDREVKSVVSDSRYDDRRSKGSSRYDDDDLKSTTSAPASSKNSKDSKKSGGIFNMFKSNGNKIEDNEESFLDNAGTLGAGVGIAGAAAAMAASLSRQNATEASSEQEHDSFEGPNQARDVESLDPEILPRAIKPAIDPQWGDLLPLPPSEPGSPLESPEELPELPDSRPDTPPEEQSLRRERLSHRRRRSIQETTKLPSNTAVPILRLGPRADPSSPGALKSSPLGSPVTPEMASTPRRASRPTSWDSSRGGIKPLRLSQHVRGGSADTSRNLFGLGLGKLTQDTDTTSAESGVRPEVEFQDVAFRDPSLRIDTAVSLTTGSGDGGGSQESTPRAEMRPEFPEVTSSSMPEAGLRDLADDPSRGEESTMGQAAWDEEPDPVDSVSKNRSSYLLNFTPPSVKSDKSVDSGDIRQDQFESTPTKQRGLLHPALSDIAEDSASADEHFSDAVEGHSEDDYFEEARDMPAEPSEEDFPLVDPPTRAVLPEPGPAAVSDDWTETAASTMTAKERKKAKKARKGKASALELAGAPSGDDQETAMGDSQPAEESESTMDRQEPPDTEPGMRSADLAGEPDVADHAMDADVSMSEPPAEPSRDPSFDAEEDADFQATLSKKERKKLKKKGKLAQVKDEPTRSDAIDLVQETNSSFPAEPSASTDLENLDQSQLDVYVSMVDPTSTEADPMDAWSTTVSSGKKKKGKGKNKNKDRGSSWDESEPSANTADALAATDKQFDTTISDNTMPEGERSLDSQYDDVTISDNVSREVPSAPQSKREALGYYPSSAGLHSASVPKGEVSDSHSYFPSAARLLPVAVPLAAAGLALSKDVEGADPDTTTEQPHEQPIETFGEVPDDSGVVASDVRDAEAGPTGRSWSQDDYPAQDIHGASANRDITETDTISEPARDITEPSEPSWTAPSKKQSKSKNKNKKKKQREVTLGEEEGQPAADDSATMEAENNEREEDTPAVLEGDYPDTKLPAEASGYDNVLDTDELAAAPEPRDGVKLGIDETGPAEEQVSRDLPAVESQGASGTDISSLQQDEARTFEETSPPMEESSPAIPLTKKQKKKLAKQQKSAAFEQPPSTMETEYSLADAGSDPTIEDPNTPAEFVSSRDIVTESTEAPTADDDPSAVAPAGESVTPEISAQEEAPPADQEPEANPDDEWAGGFSVKTSKSDRKKKKKEKKAGKTSKELDPAPTPPELEAEQPTEAEPLPNPQPLSDPEVTRGADIATESEPAGSQLQPEPEATRDDVDTVTEPELVTLQPEPEATRDDVDTVTEPEPVTLQPESEEQGESSWNVPVKKKQSKKKAKAKGKRLTLDTFEENETNDSPPDTTQPTAAAEDIQQTEASLPTSTENVAEKTEEPTPAVDLTEPAAVAEDVDMPDAEREGHSKDIAVVDSRQVESTNEPEDWTPKKMTKKEKRKAEKLAREAAAKATTPKTDPDEDAAMAEKDAEAQSPDAQPAEEPSQPQVLHSWADESQDLEPEATPLIEEPSSLADKADDDWSLPVKRGKRSISVAEPEEAVTDQRSGELEDFTMSPADALLSSARELPSGLEQEQPESVHGQPHTVQSVQDTMQPDAEATPASNAQPSTESFEAETGDDAAWTLPLKKTKRHSQSSAVGSSDLTEESALQDITEVSDLPINQPEDQDRETASLEADAAAEKEQLATVPAEANPDDTWETPVRQLSKREIREKKRKSKQTISFDDPRDKSPVKAESSGFLSEDQPREISQAENKEQAADESLWEPTPAKSKGKKKKKSKGQKVPLQDFAADPPVVLQDDELKDPAERAADRTPDNAAAADDIWDDDDFFQPKHGSRASPSKSDSPGQLQTSPKASVVDDWAEERPDEDVTERERTLDSRQNTPPLSVVDEPEFPEVERAQLVDSPAEEQLYDDDSMPSPRTTQVLHEHASQEPVMDRSNSPPLSLDEGNMTYEEYAQHVARNDPGAVAEDARHEARTFEAEEREVAQHAPEHGRDVLERDRDVPMAAEPQDTKPVIRDNESHEGHGQHEDVTAAVAGAVTGGVGALVETFGGRAARTKGHKKRKSVDRRQPREDDLFDDPALWEGAEKKHVEARGDSDMDNDFWHGDNETSKVSMGREALPTPKSEQLSDSESGGKETIRRGALLDDDDLLEESPVLGRGERALERSGPVGLLRRESELEEPVGGLLSEDSHSRSITADVGSDVGDYRRSPGRSLPVVQEVPEVEAAATKERVSTPDINRDSGFVEGSPSPKQRRSVGRFDDDDWHHQRDDGAHTSDWDAASVHTPERRSDRRLRRSPRGMPALREPDSPRATPEPEKRQRAEHYGEAAAGATAVAAMAAAAAASSRSGGSVGGQRSVSDSYHTPHAQRAHSPHSPHSLSHSPQPQSLSHSPSSRTEQTLRRSASNTSLTRRRTPDGLKFQPESPGIRAAVGPTPPRQLRSRPSSELPASRDQLQHQHSPPLSSSSSSRPAANTSRALQRDKDMTDVYDGYGEGRMGSPRSPTRPHSMRRRQSMQVLELESRVDQLLSENRMLSEARAHAENTFGQRATSALSERDAEIEALKQSLQFLQNEVGRLTEVNTGLTSANAELANGDSRRYADLGAAHGDASRELDGTRSAPGGEPGQSLEDKDAQIADLRAQLESATDQIREMQQQILTSNAGGAEFLTIRDEDYFDHRCQQLCQHAQQWVLRFSKFSDMRACRLTSELNDEKTIDRLDNAVLDGSDVDTYLNDRVKRRDIFMSMTMNMIWEFVFTRYLFGMDREQRQKLKSLEKQLTDVGPPQAVRQWRAITLTLLSRRTIFKEQRDMDTEAVVQAIFQTLCRILPPPGNLEGQIQSQLRRVMDEAVDLSIEMRTQKAEYMMLPPLQPEYDADGELAATVQFNASMMNERSGAGVPNEDLEAQGAVVRVVLFPLVVKKGDDNGVGDEEIVVCPAQVLVPRDRRHPAPSSDAGGASLGGAPSRVSVVTEAMV